MIRFSHSAELLRLPGYRRTPNESVPPRRRYRRVIAFAHGDGNGRRARGPVQQQKENEHQRDEVQVRAGGRCRLPIAVTGRQMADENFGIGVTGGSEQGRWDKAVQQTGQRITERYKRN
jgi:hypothetical protein